MPAKIVKKRPSFKRPPLVEVACGIQFQTLPSFHAVYLGLFWELVRKEFPRVHSVPPIANQVLEMPGNQPAEVTVSLANMPELPRTWLMNESNTMLIQIQQDRFLFNWKLGDEPQKLVEYPRFPTIISKYKSLLGVFNDFLASNKLPELTPVQLELTYVNHLGMNEGVTESRDLGKVLPDLAWRTTERRLPAPSQLNHRMAFNISEELKLQTAVGMVRRVRPERKDVVRFDLSARGLPQDGEIWRWFDSANECIVGAFIDLTDQKIQKAIWERTA